MSDALNSLNHRDLALSFALAALATVVVVVAQRVTGRRKISSDAFGGFVGMAVALAMLWEQDHLGNAGPWLVAAALLLTAGAAGGKRASTWLVATVWCVPGALLLVRAGMESTASTAAAWIAAAIVLVVWHPIVLGDSHWRGTGLGPALVALGATGVFVCVPDTEQAMPVFGAAVGVAVVALLLGSPRLGAGGVALVGIVLWAAAVGGSGRPGSIVGAFASVLVVALEPVVRARTHAVGGQRGRVGAWIVLGVEAAGVFLVSRVAGLERSVLVATVIAMPVVLAVAVVLALIGARPEERAGSP